MRGVNTGGGNTGSMQVNRWCVEVDGVDRVSWTRSGGAISVAGCTCNEVDCIGRRCSMGGPPGSPYVKSGR